MHMLERLRYLKSNSNIFHSNFSITATIKKFCGKQIKVTEIFVHYLTVPLILYWTQKMVLCDKKFFSHQTFKYSV